MIGARTILKHMFLKLTWKRRNFGGHSCSSNMHAWTIAFLWAEILKNYVQVVYGSRDFSLLRLRKPTFCGFFAINIKKSQKHGALRARLIYQASIFSFNHQDFFAFIISVNEKWFYGIHVCENRCDFQKERI